MPFRFLPNSRQQTFPPAESAGGDGLVAIGGELSPERMLEGYRRGIFAWPWRDGRREILGWFSPDPRAIIELSGLRLSRRVMRRIRREEFTIQVNTAFQEVVAACAGPRKSDRDTWITRSLAGCYGELFRRGCAHSVETWQEGELAGGVFGVAVGGLFAGESMFHRRADASKAALFHLVQRLRSRGFSLFDIQQATPHTRRMGAVEIPRAEYLQRLAAAIGEDVPF